jgi:hypothetical protein
LKETSFLEHVKGEFKALDSAFINDKEIKIIYPKSEKEVSREESKYKKVIMNLKNQMDGMKNY